MHDYLLKDGFLWIDDNVESEPGISRSEISCESCPAQRSLDHATEVPFRERPPRPVFSAPLEASSRYSCWELQNHDEGPWPVCDRDATWTFVVASADVRRNSQ